MMGSVGAWRTPCLVDVICDRLSCDHLSCVCVCFLQQEGELEKLLKVENDNRELVRDMRQKVEEAKSSQSSNRSRGKVLEALMAQKSSGHIPGILGRLVGTRTHTETHAHSETDTHSETHAHTQRLTHTHSETRTYSETRAQ